MIGAARRAPAAALPALAGLGLGAAVAPSLDAPWWSPRAAVGLLVLAAGLPALLAVARDADRRARRAGLAGLALVGIALVAAGASAQPLLALTGVYPVGTGALFVAACVAAWALGRRTPDRGRLLCWALAALAGAHLVFAVVQATLDVSAVGLAQIRGRAAGLYGNPVQLTVLMAGVHALSARALAGAAARGPAAVAGLGVAASAAGIQLSGGRAGLVAAAAVAGALVVRRPRRAGAVVAVLTLAGLLLAGALGGASATGRAGAEASGSGVTARTATWWSAHHAVVERPLLGHGPGRFRAATTPHRTTAIARAEGPDQLYAGAHDVAVEYLVTTGVAGLVAVAAFVVLAARGATGPLAWFAAAAGALHLVQPQAVGTTPLVLLALGAAAPPLRGVARGAPTPDPRRLAVAVRRAAAGLAACAVVLTWVLALLAAGTLVAGTHALGAARIDLSVEDAERAERLLPAWPEPAAVLATAHAYRSVVRDQPGELRSVRHWLTEATRRDPTDPVHWLRLGEFELGQGRLGAAHAAFRRALAVNPVSARALDGLRRVADDRDDAATAARLEERIDELAPRGAPQPPTARSSR